MKKHVALFILFFSLLCFTLNSIAQENISAKITAVKQNAQTIEFTVESVKPFYVGGNAHILHIGNNDFKMNRQIKKDGKGTLTFLIPVGDYNNLTDGGDAWITYGTPFEISPDQQINIKELCASNPHNSWYLGKFSKGLLKK